MNNVLAKSFDPSSGWYWLRWASLVPSLAAVFIVVALSAAAVSEAAGVWYEPPVGFAAAAAVVITAYLVAPRFKLFASTVTLVGGAILAWDLLSPPSFYPETYEGKEYEPTYLPIVVTYASGILTWCACFAWSRKAERGGLRDAV
jgi:hypothetical protein